ncbi:MAG TPA: hypothetical protein PLQ36_01200 [Candidatus Gracilibacteria bacterium]|nr:hypothetical protein [Candidatus Gracilibacteria bacterium]
MPTPPNNNLAPTQIFLPISEIRDSTVVLKTGGLRAILQVSAVNFNLKSEEEQNALIYAFQSFLNLLDFPIQILVRSKKLDVDYYIESFGNIAKNQDNQLLKKLTLEYIDYIKKLVEYADIMEKKFYVVIPYDPIRSRNRGMFAIFWDNLHPRDEVSQIRQRHFEFDSLKKGLNNRIDTIRTGLENCSLKVEQLNTPKLVELYYQSFNPVTARHQKVSDLEQTTLLNI